MNSSSDAVPGKFIVDAIHGDIHLTDREWRILDTPAFQRLRHLKQLGMGHVTYPNATHTRFAHSVGTLGIMGRILDVAEANGFPLDGYKRENLRMAALLHDIGHYPYSHLMEGVDNVTLTEEEVRNDAKDSGGGKPINAILDRYPSHVQLGKEIVQCQPDLVKAIGGSQRARKWPGCFPVRRPMIFS